MRGSGRSLRRGRISAPTPLHSLGALARRLGLRELLIKDETARFGLNAFKTAGATFAVAALVDRGAIRAGDTLVCASEGNHGRAVARAARDAACQARVYMAASVASSRVAAIEREGAQVTRVDGSYDEAVRRMADDAEAHGWTVISDTGWAGYDEIPRLIMLGYTRLMDEAANQWTAPPDAIFVPAGVGGLLAAAASWAHWRFAGAGPKIIGVEPDCAACVQAAVQHGPKTTLPGPFDTVMGGLRCGEVSQTAFATLSTLVDGYVAIEDDWAVRSDPRTRPALGRRYRGPRRRVRRRIAWRAAGNALRRLARRFPVTPRARPRLTGDGDRHRRRHRARGLRARARGALNPPTPAAAARGTLRRFRPPIRARHPSSHKRTPRPPHDGTFQR